MTGCSLLPLFHVSGQGIMWRWLYAGARMTVRDKQPLEQMLAGCTHASLVPTQLWRLLVNRSSVSLKAVLLGGAAIPVELTEQAREPGDSLLLRLWSDRVCLHGVCERSRRPGRRWFAAAGSGSENR